MAECYVYADIGIFELAVEWECDIHGSARGDGGYSFGLSKRDRRFDCEYYSRECEEEIDRQWLE